MTDLPIYSTGPSAAFFDLDRTLISGSSAFVLGIAAWRGKLVPTQPVTTGYRLPSGARRLRFGAPRDRILGAVKGVRLDDLVALNADIVPKLMAMVRPEAARLLEQHRHAGLDRRQAAGARQDIAAVR